MAHGPGLFRNDVSATFRRDAEQHETPALGIFVVLSRFVKAGDEHHFQTAKPSTSFVSYSASCTCRVDSSARDGATATADSATSNSPSVAPRAPFTAPRAASVPVSLHHRSSGSASAATAHASAADLAAREPACYC